MTSGTPALQLHARTHTGRVRQRNEDAHALMPQAQVALLADGLGGGRAGEVASDMAMNLIGEALTVSLAHAVGSVSATHEADVLRREQALRSAVSDANAAIHRHARANPDCAGMGTTLVLVHWCGTHLLVGHVGDSRAYRLRPQQWTVGQRVHQRFTIQALTRDHSTAQREADSLLTGRPGRSPVRAAEALPVRLTRALGVEPDVVLELHRHRLELGDLVLLCSDGLTDMVDDTQMEALINACLEGSGADRDFLPRAAEALLQAALDAGGRDNITVVLGLWGPGRDGFEQGVAPEERYAQSIDP